MKSETLFMCGVAGVLCLTRESKQALPETLRHFLCDLAPRGPDTNGTWASPSANAGLAHTRLSIIDLDPRSNQPMCSDDGRYALVYNGEIYNHGDVRAELQQRGHRFRTTGDTEVVLRSYIEYGEQMFDRLRGMYAFGIYDSATGEFFLARDPFGIKPLYYSRPASGFVFASRAKSIAALPGVDLRPEPAGHVGFLVWGSVPEPYTLYKGIRCLPSGSYLRVRPDGSGEPVQFATPVREFLNYAPSELPKSEAETRERLHNALADSVRAHLVSDVPVAIFLSAGIDSGVVTELASEHHREIETLTLGFDRLRDSQEDETVLSAIAAREFGVPHYSRYVDLQSFSANRARMLEQMDQPTIDGVNSYLVSWLAKERGFKVALSGLGGDELFGGYPSFEQVPRIVHSMSVAGRMPAVGKWFRRLATPWLNRFTSPKYAGMLEYGGSWAGAYLLRRALYMPWELNLLLPREMVKEGWNELASLDTMTALLEPLRDAPDFLRVSALEMCFYMRTQLLRDTDWAGMANSVEIRVPFIDMFLLRALAPLRISQFRPTKRMVATSLQRPLPREILERPKTGFSVPVREWMNNTGETAPSRGLRQWAQFIYNSFPGSQLVPNRSLAGNEGVRAHAGQDRTA